MKGINLASLPLTIRLMTPQEVNFGTATAIYGKFLLETRLSAGPEGFMPLVTRQFMYETT